MAEVGRLRHHVAAPQLWWDEMTWGYFLLSAIVSANVSAKYAGRRMIDVQAAIMQLINHPIW